MLKIIIVIIIIVIIMQEGYNLAFIYNTSLSSVDCARGVAHVAAHMGECRNEFFQHVDCTFSVTKTC